MLTKNAKTAKIKKPFIIGDTSDMIRDIYDKLDKIMDELNKKQDKI